jgi:hypothetical protein
MDPTAVATLLQRLRAHWGNLSPKPDFFSAPGGANSASHLVLRDSSGILIGLKGAERGVWLGTNRELIAGYLARRMLLPLAPRSHLITRVPGGLGGLSKEIIATGWFENTEALDKKQPSNIIANVAGAATEFLNCYGQWLAFGLSIGTQDRHAGNWICSSDGRMIGMIDLEDSLDASAHPSQFRVPLEQFGLIHSLRAETPGTVGGQRAALESGLRTFHARWFSPFGIAAVLARQTWCAGHTNAWWRPDENTFVTDVMTELLT